MPRRFFVYSSAGDAAFLGPLLRAEGASATLFTKAPEARDVLRGYVPRQTVADVPRDAIVLFDDVGHGRLGSLFRGRGHRVIGGNPLDRDLETDRLTGARIAARVGIAVPETHGFPNARAARQFIEREGGEWFVKPSGDADASCASTQNGEAETVARFLRWVEREVPANFAPCAVQKKVTGLELDCNGFFDGEQFVRPFFSTLEDKKLMDGDRGPRTGCAANVVWPWHDDASLPERSVCLIEELLRAHHAVGDIAMNMILDDAGEPWFLEWTGLRFGFDALQAFVALLDTDTAPLSEQLALFAEGKLAEWSLRPEVSLSLTTRLSIPPYPTPDRAALRELRGFPLDARLDGTHPRLYPYDVMRGEDGLPALAGSSGIVCTVGATGTDMEDCRRRVRELASDLDVPDAQWRSDLVPRYEGAMATLRDLGYLAAETPDARRA